MYYRNLDFKVTVAHHFITVSSLLPENNKKKTSNKHDSIKTK